MISGVHIMCIAEGETTDDFLDRVRIWSELNFDVVLGIELKKNSYESLSAYTYYYSQPKVINGI